MSRAFVIALLLAVPSASRAQWVHESRTAMVRSFTAASPVDAPAPAAAMSRKGKVGLWALGGFVVGAAATAIAIYAGPECCDTCIPGTALSYMIGVPLGALAGAVLGALIGTIVTLGDREDHSTRSGRARFERAHASW